MNAVEQLLVEHVRRGDVLDLAGDESVNEASMRAWDDTRTVSAAVIRDIVRGRLLPDPDPRGLRLRGARIRGRLDLNNVTSTVALELSECLLDEGLSATDARLPCLVLTRSRIEHPTAPAVDADRLSTARLWLRQTVITAHSGDGAVRLEDANLATLSCAGAQITNDAGPALAADSLTADQGVFLRAGFIGIGAGRLGAIRLPVAHLAILDCSDARLYNESGPALVADTTKIEHELYLDNFGAHGSSPGGAVSLIGAHIQQLICSGSRLRNDLGPALDAEGATIDQLLRFGGNVHMVGSGDPGAVRLVGAKVGGGAHFYETRLRNGTGPALHAEGIVTGQNVFLRKLQADGAGRSGAVDLQYAQIGGQLDCSNTQLSNKTGPALHAEGMVVRRDLYLTDELKATGGGREDVVINLFGVSVGGVLQFQSDLLQHLSDPSRLVRLDGLVYTGEPRANLLELLSTGTPFYAAQPYQQLASVYRAAGDDRMVRYVLREQRKAQLRDRELMGRPERLWVRFTGLTLGYGYQPWRALIGLFAVIALATALAFFIGDDGGLVQLRTPPAATAVQCGAIERIGVGLDIGAPLITTGASTRCGPANTSRGTVLTIASWILRLLAWAFATLFVAGFTGAVRKT
ncbi:hypothetical protein [Fodinicola acaciae]|uniref:hypothetical protein n=1 Tax=Fodinicola acaciae TaxID=2681555 RepID=UPI0013D31E0E|nr:hypothetical protein [Fodinicola acaciae]